MSLTVWGRLSSINVQKVMWTIDEAGLAYEHIPAGGSFGLLDTPGFRAMNPHGWVPVIDDDGTIVWESNAIVRYLCAEHSKVLWPATPRMRSQADQWMEWTATTLQPAVMGYFWGWYRTPQAQRNATRNGAFLTAANQAWAKLDELLAHHPYVAGDHLTMGDIPAATLLFRWYGMSIDGPVLENVEAWRSRLQERPAYRAQVMKPFDELFGRLAY